MIELPSLLPPLLMGLMGSAHCFAMCGGIAAALSFGQRGGSASATVGLHVFYSLGRVLGYGLIALLVSTLLQGVPALDLPLGRWVVAAVLFLIGLSYLNLWQGVRYIEKIGAHLWRWIKPLSQRFLPIDHPGKALVVGAIWGWLPCGLVYAALAYAAAQPTVLQSTVSMLVFGLGTMPAVVLSGVFAAQLKSVLGQQWLRATTGFAFIGFAFWTVLAPIYYPHNHANHGAEEAHHHHHH